MQMIRHHHPGKTVTDARILAMAQRLNQQLHIPRISKNRPTPNRHRGNRIEAVDEGHTPAKKLGTGHPRILTKAAKMLSPNPMLHYLSE
ncbi:hypothetical protein D3C71_1266470 [compost metagenome]